MAQQPFVTLPTEVIKEEEKPLKSSVLVTGLCSTVFLSAALSVLGSLTGSSWNPPPHPRLSPFLLGPREVRAAMVRTPRTQSQADLHPASLHAD